MRQNISEQTILFFCKGVDTFERAINLKNRLLLSIMVIQWCNGMGTAGIHSIDFLLNGKIGLTGRTAY